MIESRVFLFAVLLVLVLLVSAYFVGSCNGSSNARNKCAADALVLAKANAIDAALVADKHEAKRKEAAKSSSSLENIDAMRQNKVSAVVSAAALTLAAPLSSDARKAILEVQKLCLED